ncbi:hypothetical protein ALI144C_17095 [Actinosynnema sp. ALI-1.44]|uniref:hypothetical protein n=1 Tax=Actinosynnema sp. ALI-1.44 TaxID=1933779 RepID=UPI0009D1B296|nr:hypothetical protein [Actinosynnema sp. ALI-1.44]ONI83211.1 hypothetical protein ALI144C_17095 [Actinosynnema sp. ALI-1.44]
MKTQLSSWTVLSGGSDRDVVLAVDFPVTGRPEAGFADLAPRLEPGQAFWQTVPPQVTPGSGLTGSDYIERWDAELAGSGVTVRGILGFCVGSVYGAALAERIAARQDEPPALILLDPEQATVGTLYWQFEKMIGNLAGVFPQDKVTMLRSEAARLAEVQPPDVTRFAAELFHLFLPVAKQTLADMGLDETSSGEILGMFGAFISYLSIAAQLDVESAWRSATAISSTSPQSGLNPHRTADGSDSALVAKELRVDVEHPELLRSDRVAEAITGLLRVDQR